MLTLVKQMQGYAYTRPWDSYCCVLLCPMSTQVIDYRVVVKRLMDVRIRVLFARYPGGVFYNLHLFDWYPSQPGRFPFKCGDPGVLRQCAWKGNSIVSMSAAPNGGPRQVFRM